MTGERTEFRAEEVARIRSYLAGQSMRRTPAQLVETVREAHQQFLAAVATVPDALLRTTPREGEWSAIDVLLHVRTIAAIDATAISAVLERGEQPPDIEDAIVPAPLETTRAELLADLERFRRQLIAVVLRANPEVLSRTLPGVIGNLVPCTGASGCYSPASTHLTIPVKSRRLRKRSVYKEKEQSMKLAIDLGFPDVQWEPHITYAIEAERPGGRFRMVP